ncbi:HDOD domain-containing protein [Marinobacter sp. 1-3A]|nr:HDOD domain-containing protein [Marinobacter sp. 1-3A]
MGHHKKITTVKDVVVRLGLEKLKRWVALIGTINATSRQTSRIVLARAFVCQELARRSVSGIPADRAFLAGLLSGSDALFGVDKSAFLSELHLSDDLYAAVVFGENELGKLIALACRVERAVHMKIDLENLDRRLLRLYLKSVERVQALFNLL